MKKLLLLLLICVSIGTSSVAQTENKALQTLRAAEFEYLKTHDPQTGTIPKE